MQKLLFPALPVASLFVSMVLWRCGDYKQQESSFFELVESAEDSIVLDLDSLSPQNTTCLQLYYDEARQDTTIAMLNRALSSIDFYSIKGGEIVTRITPEIEGPNGIGKLDGFFIQGMDSIFTVHRVAYRINLIDSNARLLKSYHVYNPESKDNIMPFVRAGQPFIRDGRKVRMVGLYVGDPYADRKDYFARARIGLELNLEDGSISLSAARYPEIYQRVRAASHFSDVFISEDGGHPIYSFPLDEKIYTVDSMGARHGFFAGTSYSSEFSEARTGDILSAQEELENFVYNVSYGWIVYDAPADVYYRLVELPVPESRRQSDDLMKRYQRDYSIVILNHSLMKVGETFLSDNFTPGRMFFLVRDGLYIYKQSSRENQIVFKNFELRKR